MEDARRIEIERYLSGGMSPDEAASFLDLVKADPESLKLLGHALEDHAYLFDAARALPETRRTSRSRRARFWPSRESRLPAAFLAAGIAALVLVVVGVALSGGSPRRPAPPAPPIAVDPVDVRPTPPRPEPIRKESVLPVPPPRIEPVPPAPRLEPLPPPPSRVDAPTPPVPETPAPTRETRPAPAPEPVRIAEIERVSGEALVSGAPAAVKGPVASGQSLKTGPRGSVAIRFRDRTLVELGENTSVEGLSDRGRWLKLVEGSITLDVTRQPGNNPVVLSTPDAEISVLGTRFRLQYGSAGTRLEVREGRVRMTRLADRASVEVKTGFTAGIDLAARPLPVDEILLAPKAGALAGADWRYLQDPESPSAIVLDAPKTSNRLPSFTGDTSRVTFSFRADAERDYHVWVRGRAFATTKAIEHDAVILEFPQAQVTEPPGPNKGKAGGGERALMNGFMHQPGYAWIGGDADGKNDEVPVVVRFARPGMQVLYLYAYETPVRIDAIWISATQKSRPEASQSGPAAERK